MLLVLHCAKCSDRLVENPFMSHVLKRIKTLTGKKLMRALGSRLSDVNYNIRLAGHWRHQHPKVYLHYNYKWNHPVWSTYASCPPLRYAPYPIADLCHWVDSLHADHYLKKDHVLDIEHIFILAKKDNPHYVVDWYRVLKDRDFINQKIADPRCKTVFTFSKGLMKHCQSFVDESLWPKFDYVYPAYPVQKEYQKPESDTFNILVISSRYTEKGVPEALRAFKILRERHGERVTMDLVLHDLPSDCILPEGVTRHAIFQMNHAIKERLYHKADVFFLPCLGETVMCFVEAYAFGVPVVTTRIHHGDEFVREGQTGFLVQAPLFPFSEGFGTRWKTSHDYLRELETMRATGELESVVEESVAVLDSMISGRVDLAEMRRAARRFHAECFAPEVRNRKLLHIYNAALGKEPESRKTL